jgi:transposase
MLMFPPSVRIFVAMDPIDMRKSHHALAAIVREQLGIDVLAGHLVFFVNKRRNLAKLLFFDRSGLAILYKRLEAGSFQLPAVEGGADRAEIDPASLAMILEGIDLRSVVRRRRYRRSEDRPGVRR